MACLFHLKNSLRFSAVFVDFLSCHDMWVCVVVAMPIIRLLRLIPTSNLGQAFLFSLSHEAGRKANLLDEVFHSNRKAIFRWKQFLFENIPRAKIGVAREGLRGHGLPKYLACPVILCFEKRCPKQNTVSRLKSNAWSPLTFWAGYATAREENF